jgi:hypothetical protein
VTVAGSPAWEVLDCVSECHGYGGHRLPSTESTSTDGQGISHRHIMENLLARPRLPTAVLELRGAFKRNPNRKKARENEPICTEPLPDPPRRLLKDVKAAWREMRDRGFWLSSPDQYLVLIAATYMARHRSDECASAETALLIKVLNMIGFSPAERRKLNVTNERNRQ